ncbi:MAG: DUF1858 domain-containing protein [Eubacteriales bacterium]|nr:DUF1858 domain-containing protein [Eubacteriales bacterium]MDD4328124.1 DUF1858 domain-containing protein [Eubacteriales bacterium]NCU25841.1 DUF1858 domain-containing protein [Candidatus Nomurabacteria bacterium]
MNRSAKKVSLDDTIYEIAEKYADFPEVMAEIGFQDIMKPMMLQTAGRYMTLRKGAKLKKIDMNRIRTVLTDNGYELTEDTQS